MKRVFVTGLVVFVFASWSLPADAAPRRVVGTARMQSGDSSGIDQRGNVDFYQYQANGCKEIKDGVQAAILNVVSDGGLKLALKVLTPGYEEPALQVRMGFGACASSDAFAGPLSGPCNGKLTPRKPCAFIVPNAATYVMIEFFPNNLATPQALLTAANTAQFQADFTVVR